MSDDGRGLDLPKLFTNVAFPDSKNEAGLQLVDIVASAFTKTMNGKLPQHVYELLGVSIAHKETGLPPVRLIALGDGPSFKLSQFHTDELMAIQKRAKPFLRNRTS